MDTNVLAQDYIASQLREGIITRGDKTFKIWASAKELEEIRSITRIGNDPIQLKINSVTVSLFSCKHMPWGNVEMPVALLDILQKRSDVNLATSLAANTSNYLWFGNINLDQLVDRVAFLYKGLGIPSTINRQKVYTIELAMA